MEPDQRLRSKDDRLELLIGKRYKVTNCGCAESWILGDARLLARARLSAELVGRFEPNGIECVKLIGGLARRELN